MGFVDEDTEDSDAVEMGCDRLTGLLGKVGFSIRLGDIGFRESHIKIIARETPKSTQLLTNPRQPTEQDIETVLREMI